LEALLFLRRNEIVIHVCKLAVCCDDLLKNVFNVTKTAFCMQI